MQIQFQNVRKLQAGSSRSAKPGKLSKWALDRPVCMTRSTKKQSLTNASYIYKQSGGIICERFGTREYGQV
jgi:hypothetical protein